ncbi:hypothetical protein [Halomonas sp. KO116]|uniref:hypothetical protein n=1 Tax=Halomonas sp. KO116 TaxID=1504981 RepID=UPI0004E3FD01|nr:hypothetical protein [Halomonas sp. KO116]AJY50633.1 hypothetical protein KO116_02156 [Halomonas sp. KO116]
MDDDLKAIQDDLDRVLERLGKYLHRGQYGFCNLTPRKRTYERRPDAQFAPPPWILDGPVTSPREDAARVIFQYVCGRQREQITRYTNMAQVIFDVGCIRRQREEKTVELIEKHGEDLGHLLAAIDALSNVYAHGWQPLETIQMEMLGHAASSYRSKHVEYIGQEFGLQSHPKREVDKRAEQRFSAVLTVFNKNRQDPKRYPIGEPLFELAGEPYGMSASVVSRAYYAPGMQKELKKLGNKMDSFGNSNKS